MNEPRLKKSETLIIGVDFSEGQNESVLIVSKYEGSSMTVLRQFTGEAAEWLYKLITEENDYAFKTPIDICNDASKAFYEGFVHGLYNGYPPLITFRTVCPNCNGKGKVLNKPIGLWHKIDIYDYEQCPICDGKGSVIAI